MSLFLPRGEHGGRARIILFYGCRELYLIFKAMLEMTNEWIVAVYIDPRFRPSLSLSLYFRSSFVLFVAHVFAILPLRNKAKIFVPRIVVFPSLLRKQVLLSRFLETIARRIENNYSFEEVFEYGRIRIIYDRI